MATGNEYYTDEVGTLKLNQVQKCDFGWETVGYLVSGIKKQK